MATIESILKRIGEEKRIHYALENIRRALLCVGSPEKSVKSIVIAGTNGKGSTTLLTSHALKEAGLSVATYLSPHLMDITERFLLNLSPIPKTRLDRLAEKYEGVASEFKLSYFEFLTLLFFIWAKEEQTDIVVLEVGLGGRLDATNVTEPLACAVTSIDFDHMAYLGDTLEKILIEKLGVAKDGGILVSGVQQRELNQYVQKWSKEHRVSVTHASSLSIEPISCDWGFQTFRMDGHTFEIRNPNPRWLQNAAVSYLLIKKALPDIRIESIQRGFKNCTFAGRFETVALNPRVILSGDHNPAGVESLLETLKRLPKVPIYTVCGFSPDKPYLEMYEGLKTISTEIALCTIESLKTKYQRDYFQLTSEKVVSFPDAYKKMKGRCPKEGVLLITGSLYLVGEAKKQMQYT